MVIDVTVGALLAIALFRGWVRGFIFQLAQAGWAVAAFLVARFLGPALESTVVDIHVPAHMAPTVAFCAVFIPVYWGGSFIIYRVTREFHESVKGLTQTDRLLGLVLGGLKGALLVYIAFVVLIMTHRLSGSVPVPYATSMSGRWVMQNNFLDSDDFPRARALKALVKLGYLTYSSDTLHLIQDPHFYAILTHPKAECLRSKEIRTALLAQDWVTVLKSEEVWDLLDEPEIQEHLNAIEEGGEAHEKRNTVDDIPKYFLNPDDARPNG